MKYIRLIKNGLCKIHPHGNIKIRKDAEFRVFKSWVTAEDSEVVKGVFFRNL